MTTTSSPTEDSQTPFRLSEKHFKSRQLTKKKQSILPSLNGRGVIDLSRRCRRRSIDASVVDDLDKISLDQVEDELVIAGWDVDTDPFGGREKEMKRIGVKRRRMATNEKEVEEVVDGYIVSEGIILIPQYLSSQTQLSLLKASLSSYTLPPNPLNLSTHYSLPSIEEKSLFDRYVTGDEGLVMSLADLDAERQEKEGEDSKDDSRPTSRTPTTPSTLSKRTLINNPPASSLSYSTIHKLVSEWKGDPHSPNLKSKTATELIEKELRWANLGWVYNWTNKAYDFRGSHTSTNSINGLKSTSPPIPFPQDLSLICKETINSVPWKEVFVEDSYQVADTEEFRSVDWKKWGDDYEPDTGIVNFYGLKDTLMGHVDRSELDPFRPLVSISLGHSAIFLVGGPTRSTAPIPIVLRSGDVIIMAGRGRHAYHGVPRILEGSLPDHFGFEEDDDEVLKAAKKWIKGGRININTRSVFPAGFEIPKVVE